MNTGPTPDLKPRYVPALDPALVKPMETFRSHHDKEVVVLELADDFDGNPCVVFMFLKERRVYVCTLRVFCGRDISGAPRFTPAYNWLPTTVETSPDSAHITRSFTSGDMTWSRTCPVPVLQPVAKQEPPYVLLGAPNWHQACNVWRTEGSATYCWALGWPASKDAVFTTVATEEELRMIHTFVSGSLSVPQRDALRAALDESFAVRERAQVADAARELQRRRDLFDILARRS